MAIPNCVLTKKGAALLAKTPGGAAVPVTRWQIGTGTLPAARALEDQEKLVQPLKYLPVASVRNSGQQALVLGQFVNAGMDAFIWEELGLWAQDPEAGEILYAVGNARGSGETIEAGSEKVREFEFGMELTFAGTANVTAEISQTLIFARIKDLASKADLINGKIPEVQLPELPYAPATHAARHAAGGADPITPQSIGARPATWMPTAAQVGAAAASHTHDDRYYTKEQSLSAETAKTLGNVDTPNAALAKLKQLVDVAQTGVNAGLKTASGTYVGAGTWGEKNPNSLTFPFAPKVLIITETEDQYDCWGAVLISPQPISMGFTGTHSLRIQITWNGNTVSWHTTRDYPQYQLNFPNVTYYYLALG